MSLEFVPTGKLLAEVQKRMDTMVFIGSSNRTDDEDAMFFACCGPFHGCLGMLELGRLMVVAQEGDE
tara:strand:- start:308 stop:508 length:201 start_codon:yes stop_codon:yes gene_type:complete